MQPPHAEPLFCDVINQVVAVVEEKEQDRGERLHPSKTNKVRFKREEIEIL